MQFIEKIKNYHKASYPALFVTTHEEGRLMQDMLTICEKDKETTIHEWNAQDGLVCRSESIMHPDDTKVSTDLLKYLQRYSREDSIFVLNDFHLHFDKVINIRLLRNCWSWLKSKRNMIVFVGHKFSIPAEIQKEVQLLDYSLPDAQAIRERLAFIQSSVNKARAAADKPALKISTETTEAAVEAAKGMTYYELENAFAMAWESAKKFNQDYVKAVFDEKISQLKKNGLLTYLEPDISFDNVGGMQGLKTWLSSRKKAYSKQAQQYGLPLPKGMLLASVPGTGKTLICKAIAKEFDCPLFALDIGSIFDSLVGNSEKNMREAIKTIESIGKCVILIDEIEKSLSNSAVSGQGDSGVSSRIFGTFLSWLNDRTNPAFIVATTNNHTLLPSALIRKGRFDQMFWLDLPNAEERKEIIEVVIRKYKRDPDNFAIKTIVNGTEGFTGAEIEEVFKDSLFRAYNSGEVGEEVADRHVLEVLEEFVPFSESHEDDLQVMRKQAQGKLAMVTSKGDPIADVQKNMRKLSIAIGNED